MSFVCWFVCLLFLWQLAMAAKEQMSLSGKALVLADEGKTIFPNKNLAVLYPTRKTHGFWFDYLIERETTSIPWNLNFQLDIVRHTAVDIILKITEMTLLYKITLRNADRLSYLTKFDALSLFSAFNKHVLLLRMIINRSRWNVLDVSIINRTRNGSHFQPRFVSRRITNAFGNSRECHKNNV